MDLGCNGFSRTRSKRMSSISNRFGIKAVLDTSKMFIQKEFVRVHEGNMCSQSACIQLSVFKFHFKYSWNTCNCVCVLAICIQRFVRQVVFSFYAVVDCFKCQQMQHHEIRISKLLILFHISQLMDNQTVNNKPNVFTQLKIQK